MASIHIFNPDTDYALATGRRYYTPPAHVSILKRQLQLLPVLYAHSGDIVLVENKESLSEDLENLRNFTESGYATGIIPESIMMNGIAIMDTEEAATRSDIWRTHVPDPWGWNKSIRQFFYDISGGKAILPTEIAIEKLRELSHRRTAIRFLSIIPEKMRREIIMPEEISDPEVAVRMFERGESLYFKAPWSSSGRGILQTDGLERKHVEPWIRGIIRRQGSVMVEKAYPRSLDFASEWYCRAGEVKYLGVSVFKTSRRGKYHGNVLQSQEHLEKNIDSHVNVDLNDLIRAQKGAIEAIIAPYYDGPLGIDMLATPEKDINPCVEINLRHTMGMIGLL